MYTGYHLRFRIAPCWGFGYRGCVDGGDSFLSSGYDVARFIIKPLHLSVDGQMGQKIDWWGFPEGERLSCREPENTSKTEALVALMKGCKSMILPGQDVVS